MAEGKHAPWRLWILIVLWVLQFLLLGYSLAVYIIAIVALAAYDHEFNDSLLSNRTTTLAIAINLVIVVIFLGLTITETVMVGRRRMTPRFYLITNGVKAAIWTGLIIAGAILSSREETPYSTGIAIGVTIVLLLFFLIPFIYGLVVFFKNRGSRGVYKSFDPLLDQHTSYSAATPAHVELESQIVVGSAPGYDGQQQSATFDHRRDPRFEAYRQSMPSASAAPYSNSAPVY